MYIGAPRTGTTALQKHLFPKAKHHNIFSKNAYSSSGTTINQARSLGGANKKSIEQASKALEENSLSREEIFNSAIMNPVIHAGITRQKKSIRLLAKSIRLIANQTCSTSLISSERLCDTSASYACYSDHRSFEKEFLYIQLAEAIKLATSETCRLIVCLRSPISYLRSKYLRTFAQRRKMKGERDLSPTEYIQKQAILENNYPGTSALTPAIHAEFIKQLQKHAFVKAFGFEELLASDDIFTLMGIQGEKKYAFQNFPRENKLPFTKEQEHSIEAEITQTLQQSDFYDRIIKGQIYE